MSRLQHESLALGELDQLVRFGERGGDRLFDQEMEAVLQALPSYRMVTIGRHGDDGGVRFAEYLTVIGEGLTVELLGQRRRARGVGIHYRGELGAAQRG